MRRPSPLGLAVAVLLAARVAWTSPFTSSADLRARNDLWPSMLDATARPHGPERALRIRFYADAEYRANVIRWQDRTRGLVDDLNHVVRPVFGVRFEVDSFHRWDRSTSAARMDKVLDELAAKDPGTDVDWVVGLVAPMTLVSTSVHEIGMARELGRHFLLRGMADLEEARSIDQYLPTLERSEKEKLYSARKWHKEFSVFMHEWGHTLGAPHSRESDDYMHASYSHHETRFSPPTLQLIDIALRCRSEGTEVYACKPLLAYLEKVSPPSWYAEERTRAISILRQGVAPPSSPSPSGSSGPALSPALADAWNEAGRLIEQAAERQRTGDLEAALRATAAAAARAEKLPASGAPVWLAIGQTYHQLGALTLAEKALGRAGTGADATAARALVVRARRVYGLVEGSGVPPEREPTYVHSFLDLSHALGEGHLARRDLDQALAAYPQAPGMILLDCEAKLRAGRRKQAEKACETALGRSAELARAHYILGMALLEDGRKEDAIGHLRKAIDLDADEASPWHALGDVYRMSGKGPEVKALAEAYQKKFGKRLP